MSRQVEPANPRPCSACPWRTENHGQRHPDGWYTAANRNRLWSKLRRGDSMTCHPTDPENPIPEGAREVPVAATTHECCGALILQQREVMKAQALGSAYRGRFPRGLTRDGLVTVVERFIFGGTFARRMTRPDLNLPVSHPPLGDWEEERP